VDVVDGWVEKFNFCAAHFVGNDIASQKLRNIKIVL
jgi:hypothetical protein